MSKQFGYEVAKEVTPNRGVRRRSRVRRIVSGLAVVYLLMWFSWGTGLFWLGTGTEYRACETVYAGADGFGFGVNADGHTTGWRGDPLWWFPIVAVEGSDLPPYKLDLWLHIPKELDTFDPRIPRELSKLKVRLVRCRVSVGSTIEEGRIVEDADEAGWVTVSDRPPGIGICRRDGGNFSIPEVGSYKLEIELEVRYGDRTVTLSASEDDVTMGLGWKESPGPRSILLGTGSTIG